MSDAGERLARTRLAIIEQVHRRDRRAGVRDQRREAGEPEVAYEDPGEGWFGHIKRAVRTWWRHHPAHMGVELATPMLSAYARRKPMQFLGISALVGAAFMVARPWRVISATGIVVALLKSSQLSGLLMSAMSAADFQKDDHRPYE
ncbi:MAG: hypothetical protein K0Q43_2948 [Ramlibacter sp.]|jgi:hypothetical protein|nr:hypothetical protein [Ramlibacter sp.]